MTPAPKIKYNPGFLSRTVKEPYPELFDHNGVLVLQYVNSLSRGQLFGEQGLDTGLVRGATCVCHKDSIFGVLQKKEYLTILQESAKRDLERQLGFLLSVVFKNSIPQSLVRKVGYDFVRSVQTVEKNRVVYDQGSKADTLYVVFEGSLSVYRVETIEIEPNNHNMPDSSQAMIEQIQKLILLRKYRKERKISTITTGEMFGFDELYYGSTRQSMIKADVNSKLMTISKQLLKAYMCHFSEINDFFMKHLKSKEAFRNRSILRNKRTELFRNKIQEDMNVLIEKSKAEQGAPSSLSLTQQEYIRNKIKKLNKYRKPLVLEVCQEHSQEYWEEVFQNHSKLSNEFTDIMEPFQNKFTNQHRLRKVRKRGLFERRRASIDDRKSSSTSPLNKEMVNEDSIKLNNERKICLLNLSDSQDETMIGQKEDSLILPSLFKRVSKIRTGGAAGLVSKLRSTINKSMDIMNDSYAGSSTCYDDSQTSDQPTFCKKDYRSKSSELKKTRPSELPKFQPKGLSRLQAQLDHSGRKTKKKRPQEVRLASLILPQINNSYDGINHKMVSARENSNDRIFATEKPKKTDLEKRRCKSQLSELSKILKRTRQAEISLSGKGSQRR